MLQFCQALLDDEVAAEGMTVVVVEQLHSLKTARQHSFNAARSCLRSQAKHKPRPPGRACCSVHAHVGPAGCNAVLSDPSTE